MNRSEYTITPIGIIHTPYNDFSRGVPIQGRLAKDSRGTVEVYPEFVEGLRDIEGFSHLILLYLFHRSTETMLCRSLFTVQGSHENVRTIKKNKRRYSSAEGE